MPQPRIAHKFDSIYTVQRPLHADAILASTLINKGDLVRLESAGIGVFDTAADDSMFVGVSEGKTLTSHVAGDTGDYLPICTKCVLEIDLTSANYNWGDSMGWASSNTLEGATTSSNPGIAWYFGRDEDTITRGLVLIDIYLLIGDAGGGLFTTLL